MSNIARILEIYGAINELSDAWKQWRECKASDQPEPPGPPMPPPGPEPEPPPTGPSVKIQGVVFLNDLATAADGSDNHTFTHIPGTDKHVVNYGDGNGYNNSPRSENDLTLVSGPFPGNYKDLRLRLGGKTYGIGVYEDRLLVWVGRKDADTGGSRWDAGKTTWLYEYLIKGHAFKFIRRTKLWSARDDVAFPFFVQRPYDGWIYGGAPYPTKHKWEIWETDPLPASKRFGIGDNMGIVWLWRVKLKNAHDRSTYWWYRGNYQAGNEMWGSEKDRKPCVVPHKAFTCSMTWVPGFNSYLFFSMASGMYSLQKNSHLQIWQAPKPWGKWTRVVLDDHWGKESGVSPGVFHWNLVPGWFTADGKRGVIAYSGVGKNDRLALQRVRIR